jgi:hypothetical protein
MIYNKEKIEAILADAETGTDGEGRLFLIQQEKIAARLAGIGFMDTLDWKKCDVEMPTELGQAYFVVRQYPNGVLRLRTLPWLASLDGDEHFYSPTGLGKDILWAEIPEIELPF